MDETVDFFNFLVVLSDVFRVVLYYFWDVTKCVIMVCGVYSCECVRYCTINVACSWRDINGDLYMSAIVFSSYWDAGACFAFGALIIVNFSVRLGFFSKECVSCCVLTVQDVMSYYGESFSFLKDYRTGGG